MANLLTFKNFNYDLDTYDFEFVDNNLIIDSIDYYNTAVFYNCGFNSIPICYNNVLIYSDDRETIKNKLKKVDEHIQKYIDFGPDNIEKVVKFLSDETEFFRVYQREV